MLFVKTLLVVVAVEVWYLIVGKAQNIAICVLVFPDLAATLLVVICQFRKQGTKITALGHLLK